MYHLTVLWILVAVAAFATGRLTAHPRSVPGAPRTRRLKSSGCNHLAESDTPETNLEPVPCARCGRYYVD